MVYAVLGLYRTRHVDGVLPMAAIARKCGFDTLFVPVTDVLEVALHPALDILLLGLETRGKTPRELAT